MRNIKRYKRNRVIYVIKICYGVYNYVVLNAKRNMMIKLNIWILILIPVIGFGQGDLLSEYEKAEILLRMNKIDSAYVKFNDLEKSITKNDTLYEYALWYKIMTATHLEEIHRLNENFEKSLEFGLDALDGIEKGK